MSWTRDGERREEEDDRGQDSERRRRPAAEPEDAKLRPDAWVVLGPAERVARVAGKDVDAAVRAVPARGDRAHVLERRRARVDPNRVPRRRARGEVDRDENEEEDRHDDARKEASVTRVGPHRRSLTRAAGPGGAAADAVQDDAADVDRLGDRVQRRRPDRRLALVDDHARDALDAEVAA